MRKLIVKKNLNVRVGKASVNAACYQYLSPGSIVEVEDEVIIGDKYEGSDKWVKDPAGNYYWLGGFEQEKNDGSFNYHSKLPVALQNSSGEGNRVIIIDTGVNFSPSFFGNISTDEIDITDKSSNDKNHGTFIAGIIAAKHPELVGIATSSELISIRFKYDRNADVRSLINKFSLALDEATQKVTNSKNVLNIINISQGFKPFLVDENKEIFQSITQKIETLSKSCIIVAAGGDNKEILNPPYPASLDSVISVGCINATNLSILPSGKADIIMPKLNYKSIYTNLALSTDTGSSFATAIITALSSVVSDQPLSKAEILKKLKQYETRIADFDFQNLNTIQFNIP